jgi:predicted permease
VKVLFELYGELLPVIAFIPIGYFLKKKTEIKSGWISTPLIKILLPLLVFFNMLDADSEKIQILPVITFLLALGMVPAANFAHKRFASDSNPLLLKSSFSFFNIAFFGIPTVTALFGQDQVSTLICIYLGSALYGDTIGFFQVARTKLSFKEAAVEVAKIPFLYVLIAGVICKSIGLESPDFVKGPLGIVSFAVSAAGMFIVGFQLGDVNFKDLKMPYYSKILGFRTVAAILILGVLVLAEYLLFQKLEKQDYLILSLVPLFPVAANVTVFASFLKSEEEQSSLLVFLSLLISLILVGIAALVMM